jgi:hypothetical protein
MAFPLEAARTANPLNLRIGRETLIAGHTYMFSSTVSRVGAANNTASVSVTVEASPLVAELRGGSYWEVGTTKPLVLDASASYDPDDEDDPFTYEWKCFDAAGLACTTNVGAPLELGSRVRSRIAPNTLLAEVYDITVTVIKPGRNATASQTISVMVSPPTSVPFARPRPLTPPPTDRRSPGRLHRTAGGGQTERY